MCGTHLTRVRYFHPYSCCIPTRTEEGLRQQTSHLDDPNVHYPEVSRDLSEKRVDLVFAIYKPGSGLSPQDRGHRVSPSSIAGSITWAISRGLNQWFLSYSYGRSLCAAQCVLHKNAPPPDQLRPVANP